MFNELYRDKTNTNKEYNFVLHFYFLCDTFFPHFSYKISLSIKYSWQDEWNSKYNVVHTTLLAGAGYNQKLSRADL